MHYIYIYYRDILIVNIFENIAKVSAFKILGHNQVHVYTNIIKSALRTLKEYPKRFSILGLWKCASNFSYFQRVYQQRKDCVLESHLRTFRDLLLQEHGKKVLNLTHIFGVMLWM